MAEAEITQAIVRHLTTKGLPPSPSWLSSLIPTLRLTLPLGALQKTAEYRILASDITRSLDPTIGSTPYLPPNATSSDTKDLQLTSLPLITQVLDVEDVGRSRWSQVERMEQFERGEMTRGREIIRVVDTVDREGNVSAATTTNDRAAGSGVNGANSGGEMDDGEGSRGPHKLLLQDVKGTKIYAFEVTPVAGIGVRMDIGAKIMIRRGSISRGLLLLEGQYVEVLGGKVAAWHESWLKERKEALKSRIPGQSAASESR